MMLRHSAPFVFILIALALVNFISASAAAQVDLGPLTADEIRKYADWLELSDDERVIARTMHETYLSRAEAEYLPLLTKYGKAINEALRASHRPAGWEYDSHKLFTKAYRLEDETIKALELLDATYFNDLGALVNDHAKIERLRLRRARQVYKPDRSQLPGGNVDLFGVLDRIEFRLDRKVLVAIRVWRGEWEQRYVNLIQQVAIAGRGGNFAFARAADARARIEDEAWGGKAPGHWHAIYDEYTTRGTNGQSFAVREPLRAFVEARLHELKGVLDPIAAYEVESIYLQESYPEAYPDPASAEQIYRAALALDDLTNDQREALKQLRREFLFAHDQLTREMRDALSTFRREGLLPNGYSRNWREVQQAVGEEREQLNADQIHRISPMLTPEQLRRLPEWDFQLNPPLRPWDFDPAHRRRVYDAGAGAIDTPRPGAPTFEIADD